MHVHVERDDRIAKFWILPIRLESNGGFSRSEISKIDHLLQYHQDRIIEAWHDFFGN